MKKSSLFLFAGLLLVPASLFVFHGLPCSAKMTISNVNRSPKGMSIFMVEEQMWGGLLTSMRMSLNEPIGMTANLRAVGEYRFNYSDNIRKIAIRAGNTKVYEGLPIASLKVGPGPIGIDIESHGDGDVSVEAIGLCTAGSLIESF